MTQELFISCIESIRLQMAYDANYAYLLGGLTNSDITPYDNSKLLKSVLNLLHLHFPKDEDGFSFIEHYCFDTNFGKLGEEELVTVENLWERLTAKNQ